MVKFSQIKGFIFDLDGVIANTSIYHAQAWKQLAEKLGVSWTAELADQLKGVGRMDSLNLILKSGNKENIYSNTEKEKFCVEKNDNYLKLLNNLSEKDILPGMRELLEDLSEKKYLISLASASKNSPFVLDKLNLAQYFEASIDPTSLKNGKPDPEIYRRGAEILNLEPVQCIGVEDALAGVKSINAAGETSIGIGDASVLREADIVFADTSLVTLKNIKNAMDN